MKFIAGLFSDQGLTKKAYLNALTAMLEYGASLLVGFLVTPLLVSGLGNYLFGLWQILNRMIGYINPVSGRPGFALKATLANQQASEDYEQKRRYVGSAVAIWLMFLPLLIGVGAFVSWYAPSWLDVPAEVVWVVRTVAGLLVLNVILGAIVSVPQVTLQGENLGYKRMGMSAMLVLAGGGFTWLALFLKTGIVGVAVALVATTLVTGAFYLGVVRANTKWFGLAKPALADARQMLGLSWWFMGWNAVTTLLLASDVVVLGLFNSVESVTDYSLTKYAPETLIGAIVIVIFGIVPGLGGIVGTGDFERATRLRDEIHSFIWLTATALGASILLWNRVFLTLWVGAPHYAGTLPNLLIILAAMQLAFVRSDGNIIDLTLRMSQKVLLGLLSVTVSIVAASVLVGVYHFGIVGLCLGIMAGRLIVSIGYPLLISRFFGASVASRFGRALRPAFVTVLLFALAVAVDASASLSTGAGLAGWLFFFLLAALSGFVILVISFFTGLSDEQRRTMIRRVRVVFAKDES